MTDTQQGPRLRIRLTAHRVRMAFLHVALVIFGCDMVASFWPAFDHLWGPVAHIGVACGAVIATLAEYAGEVDHAKHQ